MTTIPDDIMEAAEQTLYAVHSDDDPAFGARLIARAILAERERCAKAIANLSEMISVRNAASEDCENGRIGQ